MGLVFDPERVAAGRIPCGPNGEDQYEAAIVLGASLAELAEQQARRDPALMAYMLYGSAAERYSDRATRRSDIDLLVVLDESGEKTVRPEVDARIAAIEQAWNVDVNALVFDRQTLEGAAQLNPFYTDHLCSKRGFSMYRTEQFFSHAFNTNGRLQKAIFGTVPFIDAWPFADAYLRARRAKFQSQLDQTYPNSTDLKGAFELPRNMGRTLVDMFQKYVAEHLDKIDPDESAITLTKYDATPKDQLLEVANITGTLGLVEEDVEKLSELNNTYTQLLEDTVAGQVSIHQYESWLRTMYEPVMERAFKLVSSATSIVQRTVELAQMDPTYDQVNFDDLIIHPDYMDEEPYFREQHELEHRAAQIEPVEYDLEKLLFKISPKHPEMAERYKKEKEWRSEARRQSDAMAIEWMEEAKRRRA